MSRLSFASLGIGVVVAAAVASSSCGYALAGRGSFLPTSIRTVGVPQLENKTTFLNVEQVITERIRTEFIGRSKYEVRPFVTGADAVLTGEIVSISGQPVGFTEQQLASRYLFTVLLHVRLTDARTTEVLWSNDALTFRSEYELSTRGNAAVEGAGFVDQERSTLDRLATDIARSVVTAILEAF